MLKIGFWHSIKYGGSPLMGGLQRGLESLGHYVADPLDPNTEYDLILVFNQIAHVPHYQYPEFPKYAPYIAFIDGAEYGYFKRFPSVACEYVNAFASGSMHHDTKNAEQQLALRRYLEGKSFPYFIREKFKWIDWPASYHPIDYPLYWKSEDHTPPNREEYLIRDKKFWQSWGASHPWRWGITHALRNAGYECYVIEENGHPRLNQYTDYFPAIRSAKACCSFDGYGSGSFRMTEVLCRTLLLQGPLTVDFPYPLVDGETCVSFDMITSGEEFISTNIVDRLEWALNAPESAFEIYQRGFHHVHEKLSEKATAEYVLKTIEAHDWTKPTPLDL